VKEDGEGEGEEMLADLCDTDVDIDEVRGLIDVSRPRPAVGAGVRDDDDEDLSLGVGEPPKSVLDPAESGGLTSTGVLDTLDTFPEVETSPSAPSELGVLCICCWNLPLTPSTALKNPPAPAVNVLEIASLVGVTNCCSSFNSCIPSESRSPISATTEGFSLHGWRGSTMSKSIGSVVRSQTSKAFVFLNSEIQRGLKSSVEFASPPRGAH